MAIGDDALSAGMDILTGNELANTLDTEENKTRDYIAQFAAGVRSIAAGGTGADNAIQALINLGALPRSEVFDGTGSIFGKVARYDAGGHLICSAPSQLNHAIPLGNVNALFGNYIPRWGGSIDQGDLFIPTAYAATSGYTVCYINSDGRVSRGASSERYKKHISEIDPASLGDLWPDLVRYQIRHGDGAWKFGYIAERLAESDDLRPFVVYQTETVKDDETGEYTTTLAADDDGNPVPDSIDFIALLIAQNAQLHQQLDLLAQRIDALEAS